MSADIINNLVAKDASASVSTSQQAQQSVNRQNIPAANGNNVPPEGVKIQKPDMEQLTEAVAKLNDHLQTINRDLYFSIDDASGQTVVKVVNSETDELIRQIPSEEVLRISQTIKEQVENLTGLIIESSA